MPGPDGDKSMILVWEKDTDLVYLMASVCIFFSFLAVTDVHFKQGSKMSVNVWICMHQCDFYLSLLESGFCSVEWVSHCKIVQRDRLWGNEEPILSTRPLVKDAFLIVNISFDVPFHVRLNKHESNSTSCGTGLIMNRRVPTVTSWNLAFVSSTPRKVF